MPLLVLVLAAAIVDESEIGCCVLCGEAGVKKAGAGAVRASAIGNWNTFCVNESK